MVGTLKDYLMQENFFELFALMGGGDAKTLEVGAGAIARVHEPPGGISTT